MRKQSINIGSLFNAFGIKRRVQGWMMSVAKGDLFFNMEKLEDF